jgi:hypothetical protein
VLSSVKIWVRINVFNSEWLPEIKRALNQFFFLIVELDGERSL